MSILVKTREATRCAVGEGCLLTASINKQIARRQSQLESFSGPSREVSVIRCVSTPNSSLRDLSSFNFVEERDLELPQPPPPRQPQFQVFIDNPRDYYSLSSEAENHTTTEDSVFSEESSEPIVPHLFDSSQESEEPEVTPLLAEMSAFEDDGDLEGLGDDFVDGVTSTSNVRRRVLGKIRMFQAAIFVNNPDNFSAEATQVREAQWLAQVEKRFEELISAISDIENEEGLSVEDSEDAEKLAVYMTTIYSEYTAKLAAKCQQARAPAQNESGPGVGGAGAAAALPPAGIAPGLQLPTRGAGGVSPASTNTSVADDFQKRKAQTSVEIESEDIRAKVKALSEEFNKISCWSTAEHHVVEASMGKIKSWKERLEKLKDKAKEVKKDTKVYNLDTGPLTLATAALGSAEGELEFVIDQIEHEDEERGLFTQSQTKAANISFPTFSGHDNEDFVKFKKDMENALRVNKVLKEDQAKKLREHLRGDALKMVPGTIEFIDEAMTLLQTVYGDARRILNNRKDKLKAMGVFFRLEKFGGNSSRSAAEAKAMVDWLISFELNLKDLMDLSTKGVDLYSSVYNEDMYTTIIKLFSATLADEVNNVSGTYKDKFEYLFKWVVDKKEKLIPSLAQSKSTSSTPASSNVPQKENEGRNSGKYGARFSQKGGGRGGSKRDSSVCPLSMSAAMFTTFKYPQRFDKCRVCSLLDKEGITEGLYEEHLTDNPVGCPLFAKMGIEDKSRYIVKAKMCWSCLDGDYIHKPGQRHADCPADRDKKWYFTCNNSKCRKMFLVCPDHTEDNSEKLIKTEKYWKSKGKTFSYTVSMSSMFSTSAASSNFQTDDEATKRIRDAVPSGLPIIAPPEGEPIFMFSYAKGKTRPVTVFYDLGCSHAMYKEGIPGGELDAVKIRQGPMVIAAAGDMTVQVNDEWVVVMERYDGKRQAMIGVTADNLTSKFPLIDTAEAHKDIVNYAKKKLNRNMSERISKLKVPPQVGGSPDVLLGIKYQSCHPEIVFQMPSGLFIAKLRLASHDNKTTAVIGGPHSSFNALLHRCDGDTANVYSVFTSSLMQWRKCGPPSLAGPIMTQEDIDLAQMTNKVEFKMIVGPKGPEEQDIELTGPDHEAQDGAEAHILLTDGFTLQCSGCGEDVIEDVRELVEDLKEQVGVKRFTIAAAALNEPDDKLSDLKLLIKFMEQGLQVDYRCPACRNCIRCRDAPQTERLSLREEVEIDAIKDSVKLDFDNKQIIGKMPMRGDPAQYLSNNRQIAEKVLVGQCRKVQRDPEAQQTIIKAFKKLTDNGYAVEFEKLTEEQKLMVESQECQHWLPWRCVYKQSVSTPCRCVFDASTKTPLLGSGRGGRCLNDMVMRGQVNTLNLVNLILRFSCGSRAFNGDLKQFYNRISLVQEQWSLQRVLYKPDLDPEADTMELIIKSLIYGVRCVSAMSEQAVLDLAASVRSSNSRLADLLISARFCDDLGDSDRDDQTVKMIIQEADVLFGKVGLECKGWTVSGSPPNPDVTHDGVSVDIAGMSWFPEIDTMVVKIPPIHFGSKLRGKLRVGTEVFEGSFADLDKFVPEKLTRRMIVSKYSAFFDPAGHFLPFTNGLKMDARRATMETEDWDSPVSLDTRKLWVVNLWKMYNKQGIHFQRAIVPSDAVDLDLQLLAAGDAADLKVAGVWGRFLRQDGQYSCQLLIGRSLLCRLDSTVPKEELESITICSNLLFIVRQALQNWKHDYIIIGDSIIAISWIISENKRMSIFHRNRVNQFKMHTDTDKLMHVRSAFNPGDIGSRPEKVKDEDVGPESQWERGLPWMTQSVESAKNSNILKPASEIRMTNDDESEYEKGFVFERELEILVRGHSASYSALHSERVERMKDRAEFSKYIFIPKGSFSKVVTITSLVFKYINKLRVKAGFNKPDVTNKVNLLPKNIVTEFAGLSWTHEGVGQGDEVRDNKVKVVLTEDDVQRAMLYWYQKASEEVKHFVKKETVQKIAVEKEGILFNRSRILDGQRLIQAAEFSADSLGTEIGLNLLTPVIERYSPIALSIAQYIHHEVAWHAGFETCFRQSMEYCFIIQGHSLFKEIGNECIKCHKLRRKFMESVMGPVSDVQLTFNGPFHTAFLDLDGPYTCYVPGFERETRNRKTLSVKNYLMIFCCPVYKLVNIQVIESRNTQSVLEGLTRLGCERGFPSMLVCDQETSFMQAVREAEINLVDLNLRSFKEFGIKFQTAPVGAHNYIGLVERKIKSVQECFEKIELKNNKLHATGLQTLAKLVENHLNNLPIGYSFGPDSNNTPMLKLITPNMCGIGRLNSRNISGPIKLPKGPKDMMNKVEKLYDAFFKIWNIVMVPRLIPTPKWFKDSPDLKIDDVVYFQKVENNLYSQWTVGQVDSLIKSKDQKIRRVVIRYHNASENVPRTTDRCVRSLVRLFNVEDAYFVRDLDLVEQLIKQMAEKESDEERRVQPLRIMRDRSGNYTLNNASLNNSRMAAGLCNCCCSGHCSMMSHDIGKRVYTVTVAMFEQSQETIEQNDVLPYVKEKISYEDCNIVPTDEDGSEDEFMVMLTALNTDFNI